MNNFEYAIHAAARKSAIEREALNMELQRYMRQRSADVLYCDRCHELKVRTDTGYCPDCGRGIAGSDRARLKDVLELDLNIWNAVHMGTPIDLPEQYDVATLNAKDAFHALLADDDSAPLLIEAAKKAGLLQ